MIDGTECEPLSISHNLKLFKPSLSFQDQSQHLFRRWRKDKIRVGVTMASFIAKLWMKLFIFLHSLYSTSQGESKTTEHPTLGNNIKWFHKNYLVELWKLTSFLEMEFSIKDPWGGVKFFQFQYQNCNFLMMNYLLLACQHNIVNQLLTVNISRLCRSELILHNLPLQLKSI